MWRVSCIRCQYCLVILLKYVFAPNKFANRKKNCCYFAFYWILLLKMTLVLVQLFSTDFAKRLRLYFAELQMKSGPTQYQTCLMLYPYCKWTQMIVAWVIFYLRCVVLLFWGWEQTVWHARIWKWQTIMDQNTVEIDWTYNRQQ